MNGLASMWGAINRESTSSDTCLNVDLANQIMPKKYVLTGGPCTGKTSLVQAMGNKGYQIVPEASTLIIRNELQKEKPLINSSIDVYQRNVLKKQLELENRLSNTIEVFLDRSIVDGLAYYKFSNTKPPKELEEAAKNNRYKLVFLLDFLSFYTTSAIRREPFEVACRLHGYVREAYEEYGYKLIDVPPLDVEGRSKFVAKKLNEISSSEERAKEPKSWYL